MQRFWRLEARLLTNQDLREAGISRLRCLNLGRCETIEEAKARGEKAGYEAAIVIARNVRLACDSGRGALWGLSREQIARLRAGETIDMADALGGFSIGYRRTEGKPEA